VLQTGFRDQCYITFRAVIKLACLNLILSLRGRVGADPGGAFGAQLDLISSCSPSKIRLE